MIHLRKIWQYDLRITYYQINQIMNNINKIFVISTVFVPLFLISLNYTTIRDFYFYSMPMNHLIIEHDMYSDDPMIFQKTYEKENSHCFTTPSMNNFCYEKPRMYEEGGISHVIGYNGIGGELHFDRTDKGISYFTIKNMTLIKENTALITFADKDYRIGNEITTKYEITDEFEYSATIEKFDTFISHCDNYEGTVVTVVQYLGITTIDGVDYFMTWHVPATSKQGLKCDYPEIIQQSLKHRFRDL